MSAVVELVDVVQEYPGSPPVRALDGVSLRDELARVDAQRDAVQRAHRW